MVTLVADSLRCPYKQRFQDDIVALTMELNLTEQKSTRVAAENKELVDRWMKRMGEEADAMNLQNEPVLNKRR